MNTIAIILVVLLVVGIGSVAAALAQLWAVGGGGEDPVGPRLPRSQSPAAPPVIPGTFRSLIRGEAHEWKDAVQWQALTQRLDQLEVAFGSVPSRPAPENYSAAWLEQRLTHIETLAGPLPEPLRPTTPIVRSRMPWKR